MIKTKGSVGRVQLQSRSSATSEEDQAERTLCGEGKARLHQGLLGSWFPIFLPPPTTTHEIDSRG